VHKEVSNDPPGDWQLMLQRVTYNYDDGHVEDGYRFIYRTKEGALQPARGQARIPSLKQAEALIARARSEGWGDDLFGEELRDVRTDTNSYQPQELEAAYREAASESDQTWDNTIADGLDDEAW
jgi:hypothetical protein